LALATAPAPSGVRQLEVDAACSAFNTDFEGRWYLYAIFGNNPAGADAAAQYPASYEYLELDFSDSSRAPEWNPDPLVGDPAPSTWQEESVAGTTSPGRWQVETFVVDRDVTTLLACDNDSWVYLGPGLNPSTGGGNDTVQDLYGGLVSNDGPLTDLTSAVSQSPDRVGYGTAAAADHLYFLAGLGGPNTVRAGLLTTVPEVQNFNNDPGGAKPIVGRYLLGSVAESGRIYLIGGRVLDVTGPTPDPVTIDDPTEMVESVVW
jgi:hypothetical protein